MESDRWQLAQQVFHDALQVGRSTRPAFVAAACRDDRELAAYVCDLLERAEEASALDHPALASTGGGGHGTEAPTASSGGYAPGATVGPYRLLRVLGEGGMGVVFEAEDERLHRRVALKVLRPGGHDPAARERLFREARLAAQVVDPRVCQIYELGMAEDRPYIAMELLSGESLAARLAAGPMPPTEAIAVAIAVLETLDVLHEHGIVHRDLKPSNIFLSSGAVKLLDFGVASPMARSDDRTVDRLTAAGTFVGTPHYASPEQITGGVVDARSDIFSAAVVTFEMLAGRLPFAGATLPALAHAVIYDVPPVLAGSPAVAAIDRIVHRALAKAPGDRYQRASAFAADLSSALRLVAPGHTVDARPILRLAVLPFRSLKPDPATDYLGPSLADALASALGGLESLVVRSTLKSARYGTPPLDLDQLASDLAVDVVLTGTLLGSGSQVKVASELVAVPSGDRMWAASLHSAADAVLDLHEELAHAVLEALPVTTHDRAHPRPGTSSERAFELYLRGMQLRSEAGAWRQALQYFSQAVEIDAAFALAWAERGRLERVLGKFEDPDRLADAQTSLARAVALDADLGAAHYYYAQLDVDMGRVADALDRLLDRAWKRRAEPAVYAGLVHACRYAGLLDASVAAHEMAARLDPTVSTSVLHTYYHRRDYARALTEVHRSSDPFEARLLGALGRRAEAIDACRREEVRFAAVPMLRAFSTGMRAALEGQSDPVAEALRGFDGTAFRDGEALFYVAEVYGVAGREADAFRMLERAVDAGFVCRDAFVHSPYLQAVRGHAAWSPLVTRVEQGQSIAVGAFDQRRGRALLGV